MVNTRLARTLVAVVMLGALVLGCGSTTASPSATTAPSQAASAAPSQLASAGTIVLTRTAPIACDAIGVDYKSVTIKVDATADPAVWAEIDGGKKIAVKWTDGFTAAGSPPVINGPKGDEVAHDGTKIDIPADANPRLGGYFVCLAADAIYVLETDPQ
jgi:hypothetical protein